jgi:amino acid adenylation domain-containing protein
MDSSHSPDITGLSPEALAELDRLLADEGVEGIGSTIPRRDPSAPTPASFSQELLWMLDRASPGMTAYNLPLARRLRGPLDVAALEQALTTLATRHESLRTRFADQDGHAVQIIDAPVAVTMRRIDLGHVPADQREREAERVVGERARTALDLAREAAFRVTLLRLADDDHVLLIETHHIVVDGWSLGIMFRELAAAYTAARAGREAALPPLPIQFGDFAAWQRDQLAGDRLTELLDFWRAQLGDAANEPLSLPTDYPRPTTPTFAGARETLVLPVGTVSALKSVGQAQEATVYMMLLAAYATVLHRYTGRENVLVGSGSAGRTVPETEGIVGYINNTLVQRADFSGDPTFAELLGRVRAGALGAYDHQDIPLEKLVLEMRQGQDRLSHAPLFEVVLTMQDTIGGTMSLENVTVEPFGIDFGATKFDITLLVSERANELALTAQYRSDLYAPATMRRFLGHVRAVLEAAAAKPETRISALPMVSPAEHAQLAAWNDTTVDEGADATLVSLFETQVARVTNRAAVVGPRVASSGVNTVTLTYAELNARANQLARHLQSLGASSNSTVGLLLDRNADAIVGLMGILKSGAAYMPLSVDAPAARTAQQLTESGTKIVVAAAGLVDRLPSSAHVVALDRDSDADTLRALADTNLDGRAASSDLAYVLYTSGSTGTPKGVAVTHANAVHYARAVSRVLADVPRSTAGDGLASLDGWRFAMASTLAADLGNTSLLPALLGGGTLHVLSKDVTTDPARFAEYVGVHRFDALKITPNHLAALAAGKTGAELASLLPARWIVLGGEALRLDVARSLLGANSCRVLNHYGPTETTVGVCTFEVTPASLAAIESLGAQTVPVGAPLANTHAYVVDDRRQELPIGIPGELLLGGSGVARGYYHRDDLTGERFVSFNGERVYRTGDRVRRLANGAIEFLGRADDQVKVRGFRIELGEIEQVLRAHPGVAQGVVLLRNDAAGEPQLVAYATAKQAGYAVSHSDRPTSEKLRDWLAAQLPEYMVPSAILLLETMPLTANGKIDKRALPAPDDAGNAADSYAAPRNETEQTLATIWQEVLKKERVGINDNFLELGGHSLLAIRVLGKISKAFGVRLALRTLFDSPTVAQLAQQVEHEKSSAAAATAAPTIVPRSRDAYRINPVGSDSGSGTPPTPAQ